jgi:hypothetical protein
MATGSKPVRLRQLDCLNKRRKFICQTAGTRHRLLTLPSSPSETPSTRLLCRKYPHPPKPNNSQFNSFIRLFHGGHSSILYINLPPRLNRHTLADHVVVTAINQHRRQDGSQQLDHALFGINPGWQVRVQSRNSWAPSSLVLARQRSAKAPGQPDLPVQRAGSRRNLESRLV